MRKKLNKLGIEGNFFNIINDNYKTPTANIIIFNSRRLNAPF